MIVVIQGWTGYRLYRGWEIQRRIHVKGGRVIQGWIQAIGAG